MTEKEELKVFLDDAFQTMDDVLARQEAELRDREIGIVKYVGYGIVRVGGLPNIRADELVLFPGNLQGLVFNIDPEQLQHPHHRHGAGHHPFARIRGAGF